MSDWSVKKNAAETSGFQEGRKKSTVISYFLGAGIIAASIVLGRSFLFYIPFLALSAIITLRWSKAPRPWVTIVSASASTPVPIAQQQFNCNVVFALWSAVFNSRYLFKLPAWIYGLVGLAIMGLFTSSINWISGNPVGNLMRQGAYFVNFVFAPFLLLPVVYVRMRDCRDHSANLKTLLFSLIIPSTVLLLAAKFLGVPDNMWEAAGHTNDLSEGFIVYRLGMAFVNFRRTDIGFILAALICASTAITISQVKTSHRRLAGACLASNVFLLLFTGSFGSGFACICGLAAIFLIQLRSVSITKVMASIAVIFCMLLLVFALAPSSTKNYLAKRYEHRVTKGDTDRLTLWGYAVDAFFQHPEGVGMTLMVGERVKTYVHNDYLGYTVSYGICGGLAYLLLMIMLLVSFFRVRKSAIRDSSALAVYLAGVGVIVALALNSITDTISNNRWYFNAIWSIIWYCYFCSHSVRTEPVKV